MSKSILVIDTPTTCNKCPLITINEKLGAFCIGFLEKMIGAYDTNGIKRPDWCPLLDLPDKVNIDDYPENIEKFF